MKIRRTPATLVVPEGLPVLAAGTHLVPEDGVCLMEYVSVLAGERFTDHPRCTEPTLAFLARLVNDTISDGGRSVLAPLAAELTVLGRVDAIGSARLVVAVVHGARTAGSSARLGRAQRRAERRLLRATGPGPLGSLARTLSPVHMRGAGRHRLTTAVSAVAEAPWPAEVDRDEALVDLLRLAMAVVREDRPERANDADARAAAGRAAFLG
jgi:hypothetical protein